MEILKKHKNLLNLDVVMVSEGQMFEKKRSNINPKNKKVVPEHKSKQEKEKPREVIPAGLNPIQQRILEFRLKRKGAK